MLMRGCGAWAVGLCESIRLGEGRSRPGLRVLRETAFNKVKFSSTRLGRVAMPRVLPGARGLRPPALFHDLRERRASRTASTYL